MPPKLEFRLVGLDGLTRGQRYGTFEAVFEHVLQLCDAIVGVALLAIDRALQHDDARALAGEIGVTQPAVVLHAQVDDGWTVA